MVRSAAELVLRFPVNVAALLRWKMGIWCDGVVGGPDSLCSPMLLAFQLRIVLETRVSLAFHLSC